MKHRNTLIALFSLLVFALLFGRGIATFGRIQFNDLIMRSTTHYTPCEDLPTFEEVEKIYNENQSTIEKIKNETNVQFTDTDGQKKQEYLEPRRVSDCPDKGDMFMYVYGSKDRDKVLEILGGNEFFGVPVTILNI